VAETAPSRSCFGASSNKLVVASTPGAAAACAAGFGDACAGVSTWARAAAGAPIRSMETMGTK
jgi:hypothetical protein